MDYPFLSTIEIAQKTPARRDVLILNRSRVTVIWYELEKLKTEDRAPLLVRATRWWLSGTKFPIIWYDPPFERLYSYALTSYVLEAVAGVEGAPGYSLADHFSLNVKRRLSGPVGGSRKYFRLLEPPEGDTHGKNGKTRHPRAHPQTRRRPKSFLIAPKAALATKISQVAAQAGQSPSFGANGAAPKNSSPKAK
jgi:hypothetical protein